MRPGGLQGRLVLLGVKLGSIGAVGGREGPEQVDGEHLDYLERGKEGDERDREGFSLRQTSG